MFSCKLKRQKKDSAFNSVLKLSLPLLGLTGVLSESSCYSPAQINLVHTQDLIILPPEELGPILFSKIIFLC